MKCTDPGKICALLPSIDSDKFDVKLYRQMGAFVLRRALPREVVEEWRAQWAEFYKSLQAKGRQVNPRNEVVVNETSPPELAALYRHPRLLDIAEAVHGPDVAFYFQRFLLKDGTNRAPVFLHQDFGYNTGWPDKTSVFIAINPAGPENGGLILYPGTHHFGFFGDAGEIDPEALAPGTPTVCPSLEPGDVLLMHPFTWHCSEPYQKGPERVLVQICYQPADDPSGVELLRGQWRIDHPSGPYLHEKIFKRSRITRLIEMQAELDKARAK